MPGPSCWREVESKVHQKGIWLLGFVGAVFLSMGSGFLIIATAIPTGTGALIVKAFLGIFILTGGSLLASTLKSLCFPHRVLHAADDVLPNVPQEPLVYEGAIVRGRLTHELCENDRGWELKPIEKTCCSDLRFIIFFGIPLLILFVVFWAWLLTIFINLILAILVSVLINSLIGGFTFLCIFLLAQTGFQHLCKLTIPRDGSDLEFDSPEMPNFEKMGWVTGLKWFFGSDAARRKLAIPRDMVAAVQLCPWKFKMQCEVAWAVQGLLMLSSTNGTDYVRLPLLLTGDFAGAAELMRKLGCALQVPYIFSADSAGWKAEAIRAKSRPPLRTSGVMT
jgi:hypothetical protein